MPKVALLIMPKYISTPIHQEAMNRLDYDECIDGDLIELILSSEEYKELWDTQIFKKINNTISTNIDDYEDCSIVNIKELEIIENIVQEQIKITIQGQILLGKFLYIIKQAIIYKTGVFFFF
ncbi:hypothetical protein RHO13_04805 [Orbus wheelerorum]|uniref:hypothetical protein n=1 Tax=Orbus wheelerorum TaxID=3074111 RepID=UPI00370D8A3F